LTGLSYESLVCRFRQEGVRTLLVKALAENDNSKNQVYLGGDSTVLSVLRPVRILEQVAAGRATRKRVRGVSFHAELNLAWLGDDGVTTPAPHAKLIYYPQYPEIRFSGFLQGCARAPSDLLRGRESGRVLALGLDRRGRILAYAGDRRSELAGVVRNMPPPERGQVYHKISLEQQSALGESHASLRKALSEVCRMGWLEGRKLNRDGVVPYSAPNGAGYTLEALLGVEANGDARPDYRGWELKAGRGGPITLLTPEPDGGLYHERGPVEFVRGYGYPDKLGRPDRLNVGGCFRVGSLHAVTGLSLESLETPGRLAWVDRDGTVAASWSHGKLLEHWCRKHGRAAYVSYESRGRGEDRRYRFLPRVKVGEGADFPRFLDALDDGRVYLDPGIKLEDASAARPRIKRRCQFRVKTKDLPSLYREFKEWNVLHG
jgi:hypothetical protein